VQRVQPVEHLLQQAPVGHPASRRDRPYVDQALMDKVVEQDAEHAEGEPDGRGQFGHGGGDAAQGKAMCG
jgi:hypothetical protein